ncbi:hypothetical protein BD410DRAFT_843808 [Rickenella mellea]|uniref:DUF6589 domain-containing protein n=1 Tax=Rickenella mellea TaxID=50990 RepID=A0A4Y7PRN5_9AGAM|nr:hypothetical protein BD410DRAFT_843808 [Rickenella mellea]
MDRDYWNADESDHSDNDGNDDCESEAESEDPACPLLQHTRGRKRRLNRDTLVLKIEGYFDQMLRDGLDLPILLDAVLWGDENCRQSDKIRYHRTALMVSDELPQILARCYKPPRPHGKGKKAKGGKRSLEEFAIQCVEKAINREMNAIAHLMKSPPSDLTTESLTDIKFDDIISALKAPTGCPILWRLLRAANYCKRQDARNTSKSPDLAMLLQISMASFCRSHHRCRIPKLLSIYLKVCGASARSLDILHAFGLTMSHRWIYDGMETLAASSMATLRNTIQTDPWFISHDNLNIPFRTFEQRLDNQNHFDSGTAATVFLAKGLDAPALNIAELRECRAAGSKEPFNPFELFEADSNAGRSFRERDICRVLRILTEAPEFSFTTYIGNKSGVFAPAPPVHQLPCGKLHKTEQYMLATVHIEEASYEGNSQLVGEWFKQLGIYSEDEQKKTGTERVIPWIGDQLTVSRLRGLFNYRSEDFNSFDRLDFVVPVFGWLHAMMTFGTSFHDQYLGTTSGYGLRQAFEILQRKGLVTTSTKGPFHHHLEEAVFHVAEAHFRACWLAEGCVKKLSDLRLKSPEELRSIATRIVRFHASTQALVDLDKIEPSDQDEVNRQVTMWNRDVLRYLDLSEAIRTGDVGIMEQHIPHLIFRFAGGKNSKYLIELLELFQALRREWPENVKTFVLSNCWLVNTTGRRDGFCPVDMAQEHNVRDIKYTFASLGPYATWDYIKKISPAIPTFRAVKDHIEDEVGASARGKSHTSPAKENDVSKLSRIYSLLDLHRITAKRKIKSTTDKSPDFVQRGIDRLQTTEVVDRWWDNRQYNRERDEVWDSDTESVNSAVNHIEDDE